MSLAVGEKTQIEIPRSGVSRVFELQHRNTLWHGEQATMVSLRDVTEVVELNRKLTQQAQAASVLTHIGDGVIHLNQDGEICLWNPAAARITGLAEAEALHHNATDVFPRWKQISAKIPLVDSDSTERPRMHSIVLEVNDEELWISISGVRFPEGVVYAFHDLGEERKLDSLKSDFIATASHELRTPLTSIYGAAKTLERTDITVDEEGRAVLLSMISSQSERLQLIIDDILSVNQIEAGCVSLSRQTVSPGQLAAGIMRNVLDQPHEGVNIDMVVEGVLPTLTTDPDKLRQVLANLLQNAVKYSPDGGDVTMTIALHGTSVQFAIADQGLGISESEQGNIFNKFYRVESQHARGIGGTGLGLYISKELITRLQGQLWVTSEHGVGSTFYVRLPADAVSDEPSISS